MDTTTLIRSLEEVASYAKGELQLKTTFIVPPMIDVQRLRAGIGLSQNEFAERYGFSTSAIRNWEQGIREPEGPARTLLALIEQNPALIESEIKKLQSA